ncbi:Short-chain dehydrogenase RED1 [Pseudocercospora fuligena]|uniref:Short-chain dehydrogenase RED1 n=1 Tax=Pseudocercospora fuligena TaxID=685502 RepID=A0A8H6REP3_9PEZI|nr:Short-chain dehydrogenase RED1 [Pseudocercospora fuligena]
MTDTRKTVLITGCSPGGIGHSLALEFHRQNFRVFATARKTSSISDLESKGIETVSLEATQESSIQALASEISSRTSGKLDYLVNNAGRNYTVPATDIELSEVRETFETNLFAVMRLCQIFTPMLIESKGTTVQIGSLAAILPYVFGSVYNASKAALHAYSETLRVELAPFDVKVVTVVTGGVKSNIARTKRTLPENSIYLPIRDMYEERLVHSQSNGVPNEEYAKGVVNQLLKSPGKDRIWEGGKSWLVWFVYTFLPRWVMGAAMTRMFQLWRLKGTWQKKVD